MNGTDIDRAREALHCIPPDLPREDWVRAAMAAHAAGLTFDDFDAWSAGADCYRAAAARDTWRSIKPGGGIGAGTLFRMAADHGHKPQQEAPQKAPTRPAGASKPARPGMGAADVWGRCAPASANHPYIAAKQGIPDGLRIVPDGDPLRIAGQSVAGWLAIPALPIGSSRNEPASLQFVPPPGEGKKLNLPGASMAGMFIVGELAQSGTAYLCEGIGQAWACWKATGRAAVCCFGWGRVRAVAAELRKRDASARLVLVPDVGKEGDAERIAAEHRCHVARMPEGEPANFDANDYALREGFDALESLLADAAEPQPEAPAWAVPAAATPDEWTRARLAPRCIVENYLFADVAALIAPGSTGKTTMTLYEAACIALGLPLWGLRVAAPGPVLIVTAEDRREFLVARLREICTSLALTDAQTARVRELVRIDDRTAATLRRLTAIVCDVVTVSAFASDIVAGCQRDGFAPVLVQFDPLVSFGVGEARVNDAEQGLIEAGRVITAGLDCCTRYVHHSGKANAREKAVDQYAGRGGSALPDGCRMVHILQALTPEEVEKLTGAELDDDESAFALHRPKVSYAPPQRDAIYVRRRGYGFRVMEAAAPKTDEQRADADDDQMLRFLGSQVESGMHYSRNGLEAARPASLSRDRARAAIARLLAGRRIEEANIEPMPTNGARTYLRPRSAANREGTKP